MQHRHKYLAAILIIAILVFCCENEENRQSDLSGMLVNHTGCKNKKSAGMTTGTPDTLSCIEYSYISSDSTLFIKHINAGFNCCPEKLYCNISLAHDTILVREFEKSALCDCDCLYDLEIEIYGAEVRNYVIIVIEPYCRDHAQLIFSIDLKQETEGTFCVSRTKYPWDVFNP